MNTTYTSTNTNTNTSTSTSNDNNTSKRSETPPPQEEEVNVIPPSPPAAPPSGLAVALARLSDLTAQIEFQYAKHLQMQKEHEIIRAKIETLEKLPVGIDAVREDLEKADGA
eukprot:104691_1